MIVPRRDVDAELARLEAKGTPTTPQALSDYHRLPEGVKDNTEDWLAGSLPIDASKQFDSFWETESEKLPPPGDPWPRIVDVEQYLLDHRGALEALHRAAEGEGYARFPVDYTQGWQSVSPHFKAMQTATKLLELEAYVCAHRGDAAGAARSVVTILMAARSLEFEPDLVSQLMFCGIRHRARSVLGELIVATDFSDADLRSIQRLLRGWDPRAALRRALAGERVNSLHDFRHLPGSPEGFIALPYDCRIYLGWMRRAEEALDKPWPKPFNEVAAIERDIDALFDGGNYFAKYNSLNAPRLAPAFEALFAGIVRCDTLDKACGGAIAAELFRRANGRWPERLEELVPELLPETPLDLYVNKPLHYCVLPDGIVVYGVGPNRIDDRGSDERSVDLSVRGELDLTFKLRKVKAH